MKKQILFLSIIFLFSCNSTNKLIKQGQYDTAVKKLVVKLEKKPKKKKAVGQLDMAYNLANSKELNHIRNLKLSGQPDIWREVYETYKNLAVRQERVDGLANEVKAKLQFAPENYRPLLDQSLNKTCDYYYALAHKKLNSGNLDDHPKAFQYLVEINKLNPDYKDVQELLAKFERVEPLYVYFHVENKYANQLPASMQRAVNSIDLSDFDQAGFRFLKEKPKNSGFQYYAEVKIYDIMISPEKTEEIFYTESADIQDGIAYKVDENGDFIVDSLGNKFEMPKYKTIACYVTESIQHKSMLVGGTVEILERATGNKIAEKEVVGETKFSHRSAKFEGDLNALSSETYELVGTREYDYPSDNAMMNKAIEKLGRNAADIVVEEIEKHKAQSESKK
jgi:hypothetical protein